MNNFKYSDSELFEVFNEIINYGEISYLFNVAIVAPLVKNSTNPNDDPNNLRHILDTISNIFEMFLLDRLNRHSPEKLKQFDFKANSSCGHPF